MKHLSGYLDWSEDSKMEVVLGSKVSHCRGEAPLVITSVGSLTSWLESYRGLSEAVLEWITGVEQQLAHLPDVSVEGLQLPSS